MVLKEDFMRNKKRIKWIIIAASMVIIAVALIVFINNNSASHGIPVEVSLVERMDIEQTVDVKGIVEGTDTADVYSGSQRRISEILVREGDKVKNGDNLPYSYYGGTARVGRKSIDINLMGATENLDKCDEDFEVVKGRFISEKDIERMASNVVISEDAAKQFYHT